MRKKKRPIGVDLFAGAGGMTLGFEQGGFDVLAAVEFDPIHCATHEFNFPLWSILCRSMTDITAQEIRDNSAIGDREIDVVFGGPPCQGFSLMGKRALDDPRNELVFHFMRLVIELKPLYFVMENVPGIAQGKHRHFLSEIINNFRANGYDVEENYQVLKASDYGVPQTRSRLFLFGCREGLPLPTYPGILTATPTVWDAIGDLPIIENYSELWDSDSAIAPLCRRPIAPYRKPSVYAKKMRGKSPLENNYSSPRKFDDQVLTGSIRTKHNEISMKRFEETKWGEAEKISRFFKLDPNGLCNTLRAGTASNKGAFTSPRPIHPYKPRCITVREAARLHSFPDWFRFHVTKWHGFRQVGNSVPPLLGKAVASEIIRVLGVTPKKHRKKIELGNEDLLKLKMSQAAQKYGVPSDIIAPRKIVPETGFTIENLDLVSRQRLETRFLEMPETGFTIENLDLVSRQRP
jgi:DNA (cytosine-5)-methyltransferase 1